MALPNPYTTNLKFDINPSTGFVLDSSGNLTAITDAFTGSTVHTTVGTQYPELVFRSAPTNRLQFGSTSGSTPNRLQTPTSISITPNACSVFAAIRQATTVPGDTTGRHILFACSSDPVLTISNDRYLSSEPFSTISKSTLLVPSSRSIVGISCGVGANTFYVNGASASNAVGASGSAATGNHQIGSSFNAGNFYGSVERLVVYGEAVSAGNAANIIAWLDELYPYTRASSTVNIVFDGDSRTVGTGATNLASWPALLNSIANLQYYNVAIAGQTMATMSANATATLTKYYRAGVTNYVVVWAGTNDLKVASYPGSSVKASLDTYRAAAVALGYRVVVVTEVPANWGTASYETERANFNTLVKADSKYPYIIDLAASTYWAAGGAGVYNDQAIYNADGVHYTAQGYRQIAAVADPVISALVNPSGAGGGSRIGIGL
jgi:lysophospholipase L1-like esterase